MLPFLVLILIDVFIILLFNLYLPATRDSISLPYSGKDYYYPFAYTCKADIIKGLQYIKKPSV